MEEIDSKTKKKVIRIRRVMEMQRPLLLEDDELKFASILKEEGESEELYNDEVVNYNTSHKKNKMLFVIKFKATDLNIEITITKFKTYLCLNYGLINIDTATRDCGISAFELFLISSILRFRRLMSRTL